MTAHATPDYRDRCLAAGMNDFTTKPVEPGALLKTIRRWTEPDSARNGSAKDPVLLDPAWQGDVNPQGENDGPPKPNSKQAPSAATPPMDTEMALARALGDRDLLKELVVIFLAETKKRISDLHRTLDNGDAEALRQCAHTIKGSAANLSVAGMADLALRLEKAAGASLAGADGLLAAMENEMRRLEAFLDLDNPPTP